MSTALRAASITLRTLLRGQFEADPLLRGFFDSGSGGTMSVTLHNPEEMGDMNLQGLSMWLYRIHRDDQHVNAPPRRVAPDRMRRPPLPLRLHYLLTPIVDNSAEASSGPELEQAILGKAVQSLHDHPVFAGADLRDDLAGQPLELYARLETLGLEEITRVWDALERSYQLCVSYEVSVVPIESGIEPAGIAPVEAVLPEIGIITGAAP